MFKEEESEEIVTHLEEVDIGEEEEFHLHHKEDLLPENHPHLPLGDPCLFLQEKLIMVELMFLECHLKLDKVSELIQNKIFILFLRR